MSGTVLHLKREFDISAVVSIHYFEYKSDFIFKSEYHDYWNLLYVESGSCEIALSNTESEPLVLKEGELFIEAPDEYYSFKASAGTVPVLFSAGFYCDSSNMPLLANRIFSCEQQQKDCLWQLSREGTLNFSTRVDDSGNYFLKRKYNQPIGGEQMISIYLEMLLIGLIRQYSSPDAGKEKITSSLSRADTVLLNRITDYYAANITRRISIEELCQEFSIGRSHLQRIFREQTGLGAIEYFCQMRISVAKQMIQENRMSLTETAQALGYTSIHYFSKQFKKITGMPPSQYQSSIRSAGSNPVYHHIDLEQGADFMPTEAPDTDSCLSFPE